jgi:NAD-dependent deacetylase
MDELIRRAAELVAAASRVVVFTGAGVSTESGIPDFRSPTGIWARYDPDDVSYQNFMRSDEGRMRYWALGRELYATVRAATPNAAHHAITELYRLGRLDCVITQNIDNLHQRAGLPAERVIELHGNGTRARCLACAVVVSRDEIQARLEAGETVPECRACGGVLKPYTVLFGEPMPAEETRLAGARARAAECFVVVGSSLVVYPAAYMPLYAKEAGARLIIVNLTPTHLDHLASVVVTGKAGEVMGRLAADVRRRLSERAATAS